MCRQPSQWELQKYIYLVALDKTQCKNRKKRIPIFSSKFLRKKQHDKIMKAKASSGSQSMVKFLVVFTIRQRTNCRGPFSFKSDLYPINFSFFFFNSKGLTGHRFYKNYQKNTQHAWQYEFDRALYLSFHYSFNQHFGSLPPFECCSTYPRPYIYEYHKNHL